ncbi:DUF3168 domain-containing protein [Pandoraea pnomenusa]|nr:DUF3168 domain-containing protein [Pandoraea pnomenusa]
MDGPGVLRRARAGFEHRGLRTESGDRQGHSSVVENQSNIRREDVYPKVFKALSASVAVTALIGTSPVRAYRHGSAPQGVTSPYLTFSFPGGAPENALEGACADQFRTQVDCWSKDDAEVEALASAVRSALEPYSFCVGYVADERDAQTEKFRISMVFDWWLPR